ncbi:hypothetical protein [Aquabacterium humicola]|uniref:hypothetical protein n=1 Tax=Aquabacterium humicola TaxID=3237377 RepID=UPI0025432431|nr:hypothetical protein [Rubrivivax pictus]
MTPSPRYVKTDGGRAALKERAPDLPRVARTLLLIIDGSKSGDDWLGLVAGSSADTLQHLVDRGYIEPVVPPPPKAPPVVAAAPAPAVAPVSVPAAAEPVDMRDLSAPPPPPAPPPLPAIEALTVVSSTGASFDALLEASTYRDLYDEMTGKARPLLGLMSGYRFVLDIEKCNGVEELRTLARRFVEIVRKEKGLVAADAFCRGLAARRAGAA